MSAPNEPTPGDDSPEDMTQEQAAPEKTLRECVIEVLHRVYDPEIPVDIYELGLIYRVEITPEGKAEIDMTLTSPSCPAAESMPAEVEQKVRAVEGIEDVALELVWEPTWTPEMMTEAARLELGMF